jgi:hypothetical protein
MDIKAGKNVQVKDIGNITNKVIAENIPNLKREMPIQVWEVSRTPNRYDKNRNSQQHIIVKTISTENIKEY